MSSSQSTAQDKQIRTGAQIVCETLIDEGVSTMFGLPGGAVLPLYGVFSQYSQLRHVLVRHEQAAAMAADGYARVTGKPGVCIATSGPGATNLITGLATSMMDSVPVVAITGQVSSAAIGTDAFQETDITGSTLAVTKHNYLVTRAEDINRVLREAFHIARTGRPGPVLVDIPRDVFQAPAEFRRDEPLNLPGYHGTITAPEEQVERLAALINSAQRPVILAGHGAIIARAFKELRLLAEKAQIPVATSLLGISAIAEDHPLSIGFPGMHGMAYTSLALDEADLIISFGARFDDRIVGDIKRFAPRARKAHVDIDPCELNKTVRVDAAVNGDVRQVLKQLIPLTSIAKRPEWLERMETLKREHPLARKAEERSPDELLQGPEVIAALSQVTGGGAIICTGVGQHQMWAAQHYRFTRHNSLITSGGLGAMGYEVPSAIGVQIGAPEEQVWSICGDGGFQMTMMELATVAENRLPVKYLIMNNNHLGMIVQWQDMFYNKDYQACAYTANPDFAKLAEAYGIKAIKVSSRGQLEPALRQAAEHSGPVLLDCIIEKVENVFPMIPSGQSVQELIEEPASL